MDTSVWQQVPYIQILHGKNTLSTSKTIKTSSQKVFSLFRVERFLYCKIEECVSSEAIEPQVYQALIKVTDYGQLKNITLHLKIGQFQLEQILTMMVD